VNRKRCRNGGSETGQEHFKRGLSHDKQNRAIHRDMPLFLRQGSRKEPGVFPHVFIITFYYAQGRNVDGVGLLFIGDSYGHIQKPDSTGQRRTRSCKKETFETGTPDK
jgi:hypothetical protein